MNAVALVTLTAALLAQAAVAPQVSNAPWCGSELRDIGRGFRLTQHMFAGAPEFTLKFQPAANPVTADGVTMAGPFQLQFSEMGFVQPAANGSALRGPHIFFSSYEIRQADGTRAAPATLKLECGETIALSARYSGTTPADEHRGATTTWGGTPPFQRQPERRCLAELRQNGRFEVSITLEGMDQPLVVIADHIPLEWAMAEVEKIWKAELGKAEQGRCRLRPVRPAPF